MNYSNQSIRKRAQKLNSPVTKMSTKILTYVFKIFVASVVVAFIMLGCVIFGALKGIIDTSPEITLTDVTPSQYKTTVYDCNGKTLETLVASGANRIYVTIDEIPKNLQNAFIAIEDERFYTHNGIDAKGIIRAAYIGISNSFRFTEGASTITQQLIKNSVFSVEEENSLSDRLKRKFQEQYMALQLEQVADKSQILENYLNTINLGNNNLGVQSAAHNYFNKDVSELTLSECAVIASITQNPSYFNPIRFPQNNSQRRKKVLDNMLEQELITKEEYEEAIKDDVYSRILNIHANATPSSAYSYYTDALIQQLMEDLMTTKGYTYTQAYNLVYRGGLSIYSCEDSEMQEKAQEVINDPDRWNGYLKYSIIVRFQIRNQAGEMSSYSETTMEKYYKELYGEDYDLIFDSKEDADAKVWEYKNLMLEKTNGAIVENSESLTYTEEPQCSYVAIENGTGAVRVLIGGRGDKTQSLTLNRAFGAQRQAGSTIKPLLVYAPAIDIAGYSTGTVLEDMPYYWDTGSLVRNDERNYAGYVTLREALAQSRNIPAIKTLDAITIPTGMNYLKEFGITTITDNDYYLPVAIGTCNVTNYQMTTAYTVFANGGAYIKPMLYTKVVDHDGNVILDNTTTQPKQVIKESTAWLITEALHSVTTDGTIHGSFTDDESLYLACKSGTSQNWVDKWVIGYGGDYTCGIWTGFDTNQPYDFETYDYGYINIWKYLIYELNGGEEASSEEKEMPSNLIPVQICKDSGKLPVDGLCNHDPRGSRVITEYYEVGTEPTEYCDLHVKVTLCKKSHMVAGDNCPEKYVDSTIRVLKKLTAKELAAYLKDEDTQILDASYAITPDALDSICDVHNSNKKKDDKKDTKKDDATDTTDNKKDDSSKEDKKDDDGD